MFIAHYYDGERGLAWYGEGQSNHAGTTTAGYQISAYDFHSFSPITHASSELEDNPLPISLVTFDATYEAGKGVQLTWKTASELNNKGFIIKRAIGNPDHFQTIADYSTHHELVGKGTSDLTHTYAIWDKETNLTSGAVHYYQLSQVNMDGTTSSFNMKAVSVNGQLTLFPPYPNPAQAATTFSFTSDRKSYAQLGIYNAFGQLVQVIYEGEVTVGKYEFSHQVNQYAAGTYVIRLLIDSQIHTKKLVVIK